MMMMPFSVLIDMFDATNECDAASVYSDKPNKDGISDVCHVKLINTCIHPQLLDVVLFGNLGF